jgi:tetratricopeptide (TPR) repeat protein
MAVSTMYLGRLRLFNNPSRSPSFPHVLQLVVIDEYCQALELTATLRHPTDYVQAPTVPSGPFLQPKEDPTSQLNAKPIAKPIDAQPEKPVERLVATDEALYLPYKIPATPEPVKPPAVVENPRPSMSPGPRVIDRGSGIQLEGMDNIIEFESNPGTASGSAEQPAAAIEHGLSRWLPALREIRSRIEQFTQGRIERISHLDQVRIPSCSPEKESYVSLSHTIQSNSSILLSLRRWGVRLLMSAASLSPANFAPSIGYLGPSESTPYYPTGDLRGDRGIAFTTAMNCLEDLEVEPQGNDDHIATKLFELAQALSDLGLYEYALNTSGYALEVLERLYVGEPNKSHLRVASVQSLRANILCDLKRNDEARDAAGRAVTLCKEHNSQAAPVPDLAYALLNHAVLLCSMGLNDESAAVAFELLCEDESQPDMMDIFALCRLCLSTPRVGADDGMDMEMAEQTIESTRTSSDANSQTVLAGALLAKSKCLPPTEQNDTPSVVSASAVTLLRSMSAARPVFSLFLAHALDNHAHNLSEANRKGESYSVRQDAVEHWQTLRATAGGAVARPLAWSLFELSKFRRRGDRNALREELQLAEDAVELFREVEPLDAPGLGDALYLYADRMLELDKNQEAVTYAEESVHCFQEAADKDPKYALDLIFSLSLASACLACTEGAEYAFMYAKRAVEVQRGRIGIGDKQYDAHLRKLLMDVVFRATEMEMQDEAAPWLQELENLTGGMHSFSL